MGMEEFLKAVRDELVIALKNACPKDTGHLSMTIPQGVQITEEGEIIFDLAEYALDVEYGTVGHYVPPSELEGWAKRKLVGPAAKKKYTEWLAERVSKKIMKKGTRPQPFIRCVLYHQLGDIVRRNKDKYLGIELPDPVLDYDLGAPSGDQRQPKKNIDCEAFA